MAESVSSAAVADFLYREARLLDVRKFGDWLDLFCEDAVFWAPAVGMDGEYITDPEARANFVRLESGGFPTLCQ